MDHRFWQILWGFFVCLFFGNSVTRRDKNSGSRVGGLENRGLSKSEVAALRLQERVQHARDSWPVSTPRLGPGLSGQAASPSGKCAKPRVGTGASSIEISLVWEYYGVFVFCFESRSMEGEYN